MHAFMLGGLWTSDVRNWPRLTLPDHGRTLPIRPDFPLLQVAVDVASHPDTTHLVEPLQAGLLDPELAALLSVLVEQGVSLVVAAPAESRPVADRLIGALDPKRSPVDLDHFGDGSRALLRAASLGVGFAATIEAGSLEDTFARLRETADLSDDELSYLGIVLVLDAAGQVAAAHHVRPIALDAHGHVQRLGPAVLAARDAATGRLEHFAWGVIPELASRIRWKAGDLELEVDRRRDALGHAAGHPS
jgi:hypothetical protein